MRLGKDSFQAVYLGRCDGGVKSHQSENMEYFFRDHHTPTTKRRMKEAAKRVSANIGQTSRSSTAPCLVDSGTLHHLPL